MRSALGSPRKFVVRVDSHEIYSGPEDIARAIHASAVARFGVERVSLGKRRPR